MVHIFDALGGTLALDVGTGSLFRLSRDAAAVLSRVIEDGWDNVRDVGEDSESEMIREFAELRGEGLLDSDDISGMMDGATVEPPGIIKAMCLNVAHDCDLRCEYCFAGKGAYNASASNARMPLEVGKAALDFLIKKSGGRHNLEVDFFGGEPLLNFGAVRGMVEYGRELERRYNKKISFTITTNAVGVTDETAAYINENMDNCVLSLDGRQETHDRTRRAANGKGSYNAALDGARKVAAGRGDKAYYVRGTYTAYNLDFHLDALSLADLGFVNISVEPVVAEPDKPYAITREHLSALFASYDALAAEMLQRRRDGNGFTFFHFMSDAEREPCLRKRLIGCGAGNEYVAVTPDGDIYPCHQFVGREGFRMGSVLTGELDAAAQARFAASNVANKAKCRACWAKYHCCGGCAANAHSANGDINEPDAIACELMRKRLELALAMSVAD